MPLLSEIPLTEFLAKVKQGLGREFQGTELDQLKTFYNEEKNRADEVAEMMAVNLIVLRVTEQGILVGFSGTRFKQVQLVCVKQDGEQVTLRGSQVEKLIPTAKPLDVVEYSGTRESSGIMQVSDIRTVGTANVDMLPDNTQQFPNILKGNKGIFCQAGGDMMVRQNTKFDTTKKREDQDKIPFCENGLVSFSLGSFHEDAGYNIWFSFNNVPIQFFDKILMEKDLRDPNYIKAVLKTVPIKIPFYLKDSKNASTNKGKPIKSFSCAGFGIIWDRSKKVVAAPSEPTAKASIPAMTEAERQMIQIVNAEADRLFGYLQQYQAISFEAAQKFLNRPEEEVLDIIGILVKDRHAACWRDPSTLEVTQMPAAMQSAVPTTQAMLDYVNPGRCMQCQQDKAISSKTGCCYECDQQQQFIPKAPTPAQIAPPPIIPPAAKPPTPPPVTQQPVPTRVTSPQTLPPAVKPKDKWWEKK